MTGIESYFRELEAIFQASTDSLGSKETRNYRVAGQPIQIQFAGRSLATLLTPAMAHLEVPGEAEEGLRILAWAQSKSSGHMPVPPWSWERYMSRGEIGGLDPNRYRAWYHLASGVLSLVDLQRRRAVFWIRDVANLPVYVVAAPFRMILSAWLTRSGLHFAHAAAVATGSGAVLLAGAGGSGKSATSLACLLAGLDFVGDDYCVVGAHPEAWVHSVYCSAKTDDRMLDQLGSLARSRQQRDYPPEEKALLLLNEHHAEQLIPGQRLVAFLAPTVQEQATTTLAPVNALAAVRALAPTTMQQIAGPDAAAWRTVLSLASQLPCYRLDLGRDVLSTPPLLRDLIEGLAGGQA